MAEVLISLIILGFLFAITIINMSGIMADDNIAKFKKAYSNLESNIYYLLHNPAIYSPSSGFKDTEAVKVEKFDLILGDKETYKFRDCIKYRLNVVKDNIPCTLYSRSVGGPIRSASGCFQTDEGIVWGVPDTDFVKYGVITVTDYDNDKVPAVPITVYLNYKDGYTVTANAIVMAVTYDGKIVILKKLGDNVVCTDKSKEMQCKVDKFINATTIKSDNGDS